MADQILTLPKPVPRQRIRPPKKYLPQTVEQRNIIMKQVRHYVAEQNLVPPMGLEDLKKHADVIMEIEGIDTSYRDYVGILVNNEMWRETLAAIPYERRLLLLPKCLRVESRCPAPFDEFGLLCKQCGLCTIQDFQVEAEKLGYAVLVAEGSAIVMSLIQTGKIDAIIGVSCIPVLERAFPYMEAAAIPGVAVPLLQDDCIDTTVDQDWIWDYIHLTSDDKTRRLDLTALRNDVDSWFSPESLNHLMGEPRDKTEAIARDWLGRAGKRWRPFLTVATHQALLPDPDSDFSDDLKKVAVAVECFHKASLIHDDIEDADNERYGEKTLHEEHGTAIALNVGDLLIGEGYRLLAQCELSPEQRAEMMRAASEGQRQLCNGQGTELCWARDPQPMKSREVLSIFRDKTAPAFEVALRLGAIVADRHQDYSDVIGTYSEALGIAYQIKDDLNDLGEEGDTNDIAGMRPSILLGIAHEKASEEQDKELLQKLWTRSADVIASQQDIEALYGRIGAVERAETLLEAYKEQAIRSLNDLDNANLKGLLRRVIGQIFNDGAIESWCSEAQGSSSELETVRAMSQAVVGK